LCKNEVSKETMNIEINIELLDKKMQENGWRFIGPILHYSQAWKNQAAIYEKDGKYVVSGIDFTGKKELYKPITKIEAEKRIKESYEEIKKHILAVID
jgi:hypothetical protein